MSDKANSILERYGKGYVTDVQLEKYLNLKVISQDEYNTIYATKHPTE